MKIGDTIRFRFGDIDSIGIIIYVRYDNGGCDYSILFDLSSREEKYVTITDDMIVNDPNIITSVTYDEFIKEYPFEESYYKVGDLIMVHDANRFYDIKRILYSSNLTLIFESSIGRTRSVAKSHIDLMPLENVDDIIRYMKIYSDFLIKLPDYIRYDIEDRFPWLIAANEHDLLLFR